MVVSLNLKIITDHSMILKRGLIYNRSNYQTINQLIPITLN